MEQLIKLTRKSFSTLKKDDVLIVRDRIRGGQDITSQKYRLSSLPESIAIYMNSRTMIINYTTRNSQIKNEDALIVKDVLDFSIYKPNSALTLISEIDEYTTKKSVLYSHFIDKVAILIDSSCKEHYYPLCDLQGININLSIDLYKQE